MHTFLSVQKSLGGRAKKSMTSPLLKSVKFYFCTETYVEMLNKCVIFYVKFGAISEKLAKIQGAIFSATLCTLGSKYFCKL